MLVLPERIELSTSPLPRECSTTELRQHPGAEANIPGGDIRQGGGPCTSAGAATVASNQLLDKFITRSLHRYMKDLPDLTPEKRTERAAREERLAKALRDNLHRRKQQQRARDEQKIVQPQRSGRDREPLP
jgi:site-specific DNA recombinase